MDPLASLLHATLYWVSPNERPTIHAVAACRGVVASAELFAMGLGFRSRHQLARLLDGEGLPPLRELAAWTRLVNWLLAWDQAGTSLCRMAVETSADPAVCYRSVKRLTGLPWSTVRARGVPWVLIQLRGRCRIMSRSSGQERCAS